MPVPRAETIHDMFGRLWNAYGPQEWWPADDPTEIVVGAILTQNTAWANVVRAIENLKRARCLSWHALHDIGERELSHLIRSSGTFRIKAARLKAFVEVLWDEYGGSLGAMLDGDVEGARRRLSAIRGIGPETADAILLYGGRRPTFVVDTYTRRVLLRHHVIEADADYETIRKLFQRSLAKDVQVYNEYHALLVAVGKSHCRSRARCQGCPLDDMPHDPDLSSRCRSTTLRTPAVSPIGKGGRKRRASNTRS